MSMRARLSPSSAVVGPAVHLICGSSWAKAGTPKARRAAMATYRAFPDTGISFVRFRLRLNLVTAGKISFRSGDPSTGEKDPKDSKDSSDNKDGAGRVDSWETPP